MARNFDTFSKEELVGIIRGYEEGPYAKAYKVSRDKLNELLEDFGKTRIDITGESKEFDNYLKMQSALPKLQENIDSLQKKIDPTILEEIRKEGLKPKYGTPEYWIKHPKQT
jgi:hypothetical protein